MTDHKPSDVLKAVVGEQRARRILDSRATFAAHRVQIWMRRRRDRRSRVHWCDIVESVVVVGDESSDTFFGYYDVSPFAPHDPSMLLAMKVRRHPSSRTPHPPAQVGLTSVSGGTFQVLASTDAWCWQQGARAQWLPGSDGLVAFNDVEDRGFVTRIFDAPGGNEIERLPEATYCFSPEGRYAFSVDFLRLGRLRPGYGYTNFKDESEGQSAPGGNGIVRLDLESGHRELILSLVDLIDVDTEVRLFHAEHYVNHVLVNPDGTRLVFLHVWEDGRVRRTRAYVCSLDGADLKRVMPSYRVSHYAWRDPDHLIAFATDSQGIGRYRLCRVSDGQVTDIDGLTIAVDGHPSYSPNGSELVFDTYPNRFGEMELMVWDRSSREVVPVGSFFSPAKFHGAERCDLHPRWGPTGQNLAVDSPHLGRRSVIVISLTARGFQ